MGRSEWLAKPIGRRRFLGRTSQVVGGVAAVAAAGGLQALTGPVALASDRTTGAAGPTSATVKGITLSGLQTDSSQLTLAELKSQIAASQTNFGATHIRLQIQQQTFVGDGSQYNASYAKTVYDAINYTLGLGLTVIINCQTEQSDVHRTYLYPNQGNSATSAFWEYMLTSKGGNFGGHPRVICDLFNEPQAPDWTTWRSAYQGLIDYIRGDLPTGLAASNQLWADANDYAASFDGCLPLKDPAGNLIYSFHHPKSAAGGDTAGWDADFGNWAATHPVVNGEFAQNSNFNWGSPYEVQRYLNYCADRGIGHTLWTVYGDGYFSDATYMPYGWWGNLINDFWNPGNGWTSYCFRSSVAWSQNYVMRTGNQLTWPNGLYQGWSPELNSMLAGAAGFNTFVPDMARGKRYRMHVSFQCVWVDSRKTTAVVLGVHGLAAKPKSWGGMRPQAPNILQLDNVTTGQWCTMDIPSSYVERFATGYYKGILFGPGPDATGPFSAHMSFTPEVVLEVHQ